MEKSSKLILKTLSWMRRLFGSDHYSIVPLFHPSMWMTQIEITIKLILNPYCYRNSEMYYKIFFNGNEVALR
jgi:hypothetical protein